MSEKIVRQVRDYYDGRLTAYGPSPNGVDWKSGDTQELRFRELCRLVDGRPDASLVDYGCGYGALLTYLRNERGHTGAYVGYDVSEHMVTAARAASTGSGDTFTSRREDVPRSDFVVASGILNVKQDVPVAEWQEYVLRTLDDMASLGRSGFAFNALSTYSDEDKRRGDLFYANPTWFVDYCAKRYSRFVALLHDTPLWEFTLLVRY